jgi:arylsulfatase A-like enzyme
VGGERAVHTPVFDRIAGQGALFTHAFVSSPSCTPSRAALLTGQHFWRLGPTANLWSAWPGNLTTYPRMLEQAGYHVGMQGKGWAPGSLGPQRHNPAGKAYANFDAYLADRPEGAPLCFWFGSPDPHRPYDLKVASEWKIDPAQVRVPAHLPDTPEVRADIAAYLAEIARFDAALGRIIASLEAIGELDRTLIIVTSDNGMPFPRCKANLYDMGTRVPLAIRWGQRIKPGQVIHSLVSNTDLAPTILSAAGLPVPPEMTGVSLLPELMGAPVAMRDAAYFGRERHASVRAGNVGYPARAVRTAEFLFIRNFEPDRHPAGDPVPPKDVPSAMPPYGDIDAGPTKAFMFEQRDRLPELFHLSFGKRPAHELYDLQHDPAQMHNLAHEPAHADKVRQLSAMLEQQMKATADPRAADTPPPFDQYEYVNPRPRREQ